jgi:transcriptional regulator with XRE-family HTH domain
MVPDDYRRRRSHNPNMAKPTTAQSDFQHTWYLREWMNLAGKRQADLIREIGWSRAKASDVWNGQQYTQLMIDQVAPWLHARPYELLMHPEEAMALRRLREDAARIVSDTAHIRAAS